MPWRAMDPMDEPEKRMLMARGQICRPVGWGRDARRTTLRFRRLARRQAKRR